VGVAEEKLIGESKMTDVPLKLEQEFKDEYLASLERGIAVRRHGTVWTFVGLVALLIGIYALNISDYMAVAITVAAASVYLVWAIYSVSASLHLQFDGLTKIVLYYAESNARKTH
jgi:hypothetical protein